MIGAFCEGCPRSKDSEARLDILVGELRELEGWPHLYLDAGLLMGDLLAALGCPPSRLVELLGFDPAEWADRQRVGLEAGVPPFNDANTTPPQTAVQ